KYIDYVRSEIDDKLINLSSEERERFWCSIADQNGFSDILEAAQRDEEQIGILSSCAYDYSLMMKGLLLSAGNRIDRMLTEHPDSIVRERYSQMKDLSARLDNVSLRGGDPTQIKFLREALASARRDIDMAVRRMGVESDMVGGGAVSWRDVQSRLEDDEVAIEFMRLTVEYDLTVDPLYVAVVLRRGWESPRMVELCRESVLAKYVSTDRILNRRLYNSYKITELWPLIWQPLQEYIAEGDTVYFSADGVVNILNIGAIRPDDSDRRMVDERYVLRRLSSTRELCRDRTETKWSNAVLYGGLNYEMGDEAMSEAARAYRDVDLGVSRGSSSGNEVPRTELPQTYREAVDIAAMLESCGIRPELITGDNGVEESFKALSGRNFQLLHVGTHGFYMEGMADYQSTDEELSPMLRSGVVMSGRRNPDPNDREDGLLFARE
ncbi:MAG: CHAT domain-containing protein, partial [Alistipes sp.]|nr:CHAT domain-containing protein [Alistipes sp.]